MNFVSDSAVGAFKYFRLGGTLSQPDHVKYYALSVGHEAHCVDGGKAIHSNDIPRKGEGSIRICVLSDTHERHHLFTAIPPCDILVHAGDILMTGRMLSHNRASYEMACFNEWLGKLDAKHRFVIGGNHDVVLEKLGHEQSQAILTHATYLCNTSVEVMGMNIFGSPLSTGASGNSAFQSHEFAVEAHEKLSRLAESAHPVDILITHGPCNSLGRTVKPRIMHISGHVHANHGVRIGRSRQSSEGEVEGPLHEWFQVASPIMDHRYNPTQLPIVIDVLNPVVA